MPRDNQLMTEEERRVFLEINKEWLGDLLVAEFGFYDHTEGIGMSDADTIEILEDRKRRNQPWRMHIQNSSSTR